MLGLFVLQPWPQFYINGMKTWEIRSYPIDYRGPILIIESRTNKVVCEMDLINCIPLTKELWEMNFEKHRTSCSFESLPYKNNESVAYAWVLENTRIYNDDIYIERKNKKPYMFLEDNIILNKPYKIITTKNERIACKFINDNMLLYWIKKNYFALIGIMNLSFGTFDFITSEIKDEEIEYILSQINVKRS